MKKLLLYFFLNVLIIFNFSNIGQTQEWIKRYPESGHGWSSDMVITPDGGFLLAGTTVVDSLVPSNPSIIIKTDSEGNKEWQKILPVDQAIRKVSCAETNSNKYLAAGLFFTDFPFNFVAYIQVMDSVGNVQWEYYGQNASKQMITDIIPTSDGGILACGTESIELPNNAETSFAFLLKFDAQANLSWQYNWSDSNYEESGASRVHVHSDGNYILLGQCISDEDMVEDGDIFWAKIDTSGNLIQNEIFYTPDQSNTVADFETDSLGNYWIVGKYKELVNGPTLAGIYKVSPDGQLLSSNYYDDYSIWYATGITLTPDGGAVVNSVNFNGGGSGDWITFKVDGQLNSVWTNSFEWLGEGTKRGVAIESLPNGGFAILGNQYMVEPELNKMVLLKTDSFANVFSQNLAGQVVYDENTNCLIDSPERPLKNRMIKIIGNDQILYASTDENGFYKMPIDTGEYVLQLIGNSAYWGECSGPINLNIGPGSDTIIVDYPLQANISCPNLEVDVSTPFLRRCFPNIYYVKYCNTGTTPAANTYLEATFDPFITVDSSEVPWIDVQGATYTFLLDSVDMEECGHFKIYTTLECDTSIMGFTHCVEAHIYPDTICLPPDTSWSGAIIDVKAECTGDSAHFYIINSGMGDMTDYLNFIVVEDSLMVKPIADSFLLNSQDTFFIVLPATGGTYYLGAEQAPGHPLGDFPSLTLEGSGTDSLGNVSLGFVNQFSQNDASPFISVDCQENIGSWDPNDKAGFPKGYGAEHFIEKNTDIEYRIRFQNTGTDTAFRVEIRDTLSNYLDLGSIQLGASSHDYVFRLEKDGSLAFIFDDIMLPDSNINEPASHGFVNFRIRQLPDNPIGTEIFNQAAIYFDFNPPVITNETVHRVGENFLEVQVVSTKELGATENVLKVYPNPFKQSAILKWEGSNPLQNASFILFDALGREVRREVFHGHQWRLDRGSLQQGLYFFVIEHKGRVVANGKLVTD